MWFALFSTIASGGRGGALIDGVSLADLGLFLPACDARPNPTPTLDLDAACVGAACAAMSVPELERALGAPAKCRRTVVDDRPPVWACDWEGGAVSVLVHADPADGPSALPVHDLFLKSGVSATTAEGLGVGVAASCFLDRRATQVVSADISVRGGALYLRSVHLQTPPVILSIDPAGRVEKLQLSSR